MACYAMLATTITLSRYKGRKINLVTAFLTHYGSYKNRCLYTKYSVLSNTFKYDKVCTKCVKILCPLEEYALQHERQSCWLKQAQQCLSMNMLWNSIFKDSLLICNSRLSQPIYLPAKLLTTVISTWNQATAKFYQYILYKRLSLDLWKSIKLVFIYVNR